MQAGKLRDRVSVLEQQQTQGADGGVSEAWVVRQTRYGHVEPLREVEQTDASSIEGRLTHRVTMRWADQPITSRHRLRFRSREFHIDQALEDTRRRHVRCLCVELT